MHRSSVLILVVAAAMLLVAPLAVQAKVFSAWGQGMPEVGINSLSADGCPIESPDGLRLFIASNRPGGTVTGDPNDIWVAERPSVESPWSTPVNLGRPVNSEAADFCPTPLTGKRLLFVSTRSGAGTCGAGDIYLTRENPAHGWEQPVHLGCDATGTGPNFPGGEFGPSLVETDEGTFLYFSSNGYGGATQDIYVSRRLADGSFAPATPVSELNSPANDLMPNVSRNGLEIVFASNRAGNQDIYTAHRASTSDAWSSPVRVESVSTPGTESRPSLSADGERLHFGRDGDIYVSTRTKVTGG